MGRVSNRRKLAAAIGIIAIVAAIAFVRIAFAPRLGGPLPATAGWEYTFEAGQGEQASWSIPLPGSTFGAVRLTEIQFNGLHGAKILGYGLCRTKSPAEPGGDIIRCAPVTARSWPPPGVEVIGLDAGEILEGLDPLLDLVVGVERTDSSRPSGWATITLVYTTADGTYQVEEPWSIKLVNRGDLPVE